MNYECISVPYVQQKRETREAGKRRHGYSRDKRSDCVQVVIALIVTPDGLPLAYEVMPGNTSDKTTLRVAMLSNFGPGVLANFGPPPVPQPTVTLMDQGALCGLESQSGFVRATRS
jgi:hypothetical protein